MTDQEKIVADWRKAEAELRRVRCGLPPTDKEKPAGEAGEKRGRVFKPWFDETGRIIGR